jgi:NAD(P)-dependent dehydrogenase (short-subunit alcohol dehydrogenase family)
VTGDQQTYANRKVSQVDEGRGMALGGRVALITGAGSGIGAATARRLARHGAAVAVTDLVPAAAERVAKEIEAAGGRAAPYELDVTVEDAWRAVVARVQADLGAITVLHGNAAPSGGDVILRDLDVLTVDVDRWDAMMRVVLRGNMLACKHAMPSMIAAGGGSIVLTTSIKGRTGSSVRTAYSAAKAGLDQLVRMVATGYGRVGVRCNGIAPGIIVTPGLRAAASDEYLTQLAAAQLIPRLGDPEDIAAAVHYLAADASSFLTGQTLVVDGGMTSFVPVFAPEITLPEGLRP